MNASQQRVSDALDALTVAVEDATLPNGVVWSLGYLRAWMEEQIVSDPDRDFDWLRDLIDDAYLNSHGGSAFVQSVRRHGYVMVPFADFDVTVRLASAFAGLFGANDEERSASARMQGVLSDE